MDNEGTGMSASNDVITRLRSTGSNLMQTRWDGQARESGVLYARARPRRVEITERYWVEQEISNSPKIDMKEDRRGHIAVAIPYDGRDYFTRQARDDVSHGSRGREVTPDHKVRIGHLLLDNDSRTNLRDVLREHSGEGSLPLEVTFADGTDLDAFCADRATCLITHDYQPASPEIIPVVLDIAVLDPDSVDLPDIDLVPGDKPESAQQVRERIKQHNVINRIRQQVNFRNTLAVSISVSLTVPDPDPDSMSQDAEIKPTLARIAIAWPTITSLRTLDLKLVDQHSLREHLVTYNPVAECVEWYGVPMVAESSQRGDNGMRTYHSPSMVLSIDQPGELYEQERLTVTAEVKVGGYLLSGLGARLYDAQGFVSQACTPELTTRVRTKVDLVLDDAFRKRTISPYQHLFFDEIIPDEMRITDIMTALQDRKFKVGNPIKITDGTRGGTMLGTDSWFLGARRQEGPDKMDLWLFVEGTSFEVQRDRMQAGDGSEQRLRRTLKSGELRIFIRGALPQDSPSIMHEMNALHQMLRERYEYVRSHG
jgi:hypothetical protein